MAEVQATEIKMTKLVLGLSDREKEILAAILQNPHHDDETEEARKLRESIFNALKPKPLTR